MDIFYPIQFFTNWLTYSLLGLSKKSLPAESLNFFIYDSIKILILLFVIIFLVTFLRSYFPPERIKKILNTRFEFVGNILAALIGVITPFCSCSAIPLFIGFVESGVPLGVTFSYLISAPMVNEIALIMLLSLFGLKVALIYIVSGVLIAIFAGFILGRMKLEHLVQDYVWEINTKGNSFEQKLTFKERFDKSQRYTVNLVKKVFPFVLLGVGMGSLIHGYAPENFLVQFAGKNNLLAVPLVVAIGVPLYSSASGMVPIVRSLMEKGLPLGTSLSFMMSVTALSLPEMIILKKVLKLKLLIIYVSVVALGIIFTGYLFNAVL